MKLLLARHGQAYSQAEDPECGLSAQGAAEVTAVAALLRRAGVSCRRVLHSNKKRAAQTAELLIRGLELEVAGEEHDLLHANDDPQAFAWQSDAWDQDTLVVGHLPFMGRLVSHLLTGNERVNLVEFSPGSVACLEKRAAGGWHLVWMVGPDLLPPVDWAAGQLP